MKAPILLTLVMGCQTDLTLPAQKANVDPAFFRCNVQPILTKSCGALACHGDGRRYFVLFGRNRLRLGGTEATRNAALRDDERTFNFESARAYVDPSSPANSLILRKPLEGSAYHTGAVTFGMGNVFPSKDDSEWKVIESWVNGATDDPLCVEPGSDQ